MSSRSPRASPPTAPQLKTGMPSRARSMLGPAAVPAAVALISSKRTDACPGGMLSTGRPRMSRMWTPTLNTGPRLICYRPPLLARCRDVHRVAPAPGLGSHLVQLFGRQDPRLTDLQGQAVGAGEPLQHESLVVRLPK